MRILAFSFLLASCASAAENPDYSFEGINGPAGTEYSGSVIFVYKNLSSTSQCINVTDFIEHPWHQALRVYDNDGKSQQYAGVLAKRGPRYASVIDISDAYPPGQYYILAPGDEAISHFSIVDNYEVIPNENYTVRYTIPITNCEAISAGLKEIPSAYEPFLVEPAFQLKANDSDWRERLSIHTKTWDKWASVGFWAELKPIEFSIHEPD